MLIHGAMGYSDTPEDKEEVYLVITIFGAIFFALSILLFGKYGFLTLLRVLNVSFSVFYEVDPPDLLEERERPLERVRGAGAHC